MNRSRVALYSTALLVGTLLAGTAVPVSGRGEPSQPAAPVAAPVEAELLETIGLLAGTQLYQTYLNIGFLADARVEGTYDDESCGKLLASVLVPLDKVDKRLESLVKTTGKKPDQAALIRLRKVAKLLQLQGKHLQTLWAGGKTTDREKYEAARKSAWKELSDLLQINEE